MKQLARVACLAIPRGAIAVPAVHLGGNPALAGCGSGTAPAPSPAAAAPPDAGRGARDASGNEAQAFFPPGALDRWREGDACRALW